MIYGYTIANDVTARDLQRSDVQFTRAKGFDSFCPLGPVDRDRPRPADFADGVRVQTHLNGDLVQDGTHQGHDLRRPDAGRPRLQRDDAAARRRDPHRHPRGRRSHAASATRSRSRSRHRHPDQQGGHRVTDPSSATWRPTASASASARRPTGSPHVGLARTRPVQLGVRPPPRRHASCFRIEDTDAARNTQESYDSLLDVAALAGLRLGRGPGGRRPATGPTGSPSASTSTPTSLARLREAGVRLRLLLHHRGGRRAPQGLRLQGAWGTTASAATLTAEQVAAFAGRGPHAGRALPDARRRDHLRRPGPRRDHLPAPSTCPTSRSCRANGDPLYTLVNPVDDALMEITHVLRGEDLLSSHAAPDRALRRAAARSASATGDAARSATCPT